MYQIAAACVSCGLPPKAQVYAAVRKQELEGVSLPWGMCPCPHYSKNCADVECSCSGFLVCFSGCSAPLGGFRFPIWNGMEKACFVVLPVTLPSVSAEPL